MSTTTYPASPADLPRKLTALSSSYQLKAFLAILSIILFFALYIALVIGMGYLVYGAIFYEIETINKFTILLKLGAIAGSVMLLVFTLKFIFKLRNHKPENRLKLNKKDHPELISFVEKICQETGAPRPRNIYVDPDVNAYVSYSNMWLSLFLPVRKDLTIGLGLVDCLNLSEFKAVVAHEFGHFAQRSMKIGSYIVSANTIIHGMIFDRDKWDDALEQWRNSDIRLSAAAWAITPVIWLIRQLLRLFYIFLNIMHSSLSREMEFNADKVAVSTSGSEAIVSALWKLDGGAQSWNNTVNHAYLAAQKKLFSENLYQHNAMDLERMAPVIDKALAELPSDEMGSKKFFSGSENSKVSMYASHPPNDQREASAKNPFIPCPTDERSPWILFSNVDGLQKEMTELIYKKYLGKSPEAYMDAEEFEAFIKAESHGKELMEAYANTFVNRYLNIPSEEEISAANIPDVEDPKAGAEKLKEDVKTLMKPVEEIEGFMVKAQQVAEGTVTDKSITYNGSTFEKKEMNALYQQLHADREKLFSEAFKEWDTTFCAFHLALAKEKGREAELKNLYLQHEALIRFYKVASGIHNFVFTGLQQLQQNSELTETELIEFGQEVVKCGNTLNEELNKFDQLTFVPLPNVEDVGDLKAAIVDDGQFPKISGAIFENGDFNKIAPAIQNAVMHCQRLDQKSIGAILSFHEELIGE